MTRLALEPLSIPRPVAVTAARAPHHGLWSAHADGTLRTWRDARVVRALAVGVPIAGVDLAHGMVVSWAGRSVTLHTAPAGGAHLEPPRAAWAFAGRIERAFCIAPDEVEVYSVETDGPPYDRCGHRHRARRGEERSELLATAWGMPPPFGAEGVQPQSSPDDATLLHDGPEGRIALHDRHAPTPHATATRRGGRVLRLEGPGKELQGGCFAARPGAPSDVLAWDFDRLWWCDGSTGRGLSIAVRDVVQVAAVGDEALVLLPRGLARLTRTA